MSTIDDLLAQSLLLHQPDVPSDVVPYDDLAYVDLTYAGLAESHLLWDVGPEAADDGAAQNLTALCEAVVAHCTAEQLADFLTDQVPQPRAAWILGCALQIAGVDDGARFWWQYAAGAEDAPASYCLYLQHLAQGDAHAAALWQAQAGAHAPQTRTDTGRGDDAPAYRMMTADASFPTVLRILSRLTRTAPRRHTPMARAVIEFVATAVAVGYDQHPDFEIPVPGTDFAEQLEIVASAASGRGKRTCSTEAAAAGTEELPNRPPVGSDVEHTRANGPERLRVEVTTDDEEESASAATFFREASAVNFWETASAESGTEEHGRRVAYYLSRLRIRAARTFSSAPSGFGVTVTSGFGSPSFRGL
ncbi:hypothetical protein [Streptomyces sp. NPDC005423]|uniref:hypothetical protein n=1 Tax=Streptomyces sp. NPDC005423 TaxID=3155343 RepID=UPI0033BBF4C5